MSERILKALMQLFAIISRPESEPTDRRKIVEGFLRKQLNQQLAQEYILIFDNYYLQYQEKYKDRRKQRKYTSSSSVKTLVICAQINNELSQQQKFSLMVLLLSFIRSGQEKQNAISKFERNFVETVAQAFNFDDAEFQEMVQFVMLPVDDLPDTPNLLFVNNHISAAHNNPENSRNCQHLYRDGLTNHIAVLHIHSVDMYICRYEGARELFLNSQGMTADSVYVLNYGCCIRNSQIKPVYYSDIVDCFYLGKHSEPLLFEARNVEYRFESGDIGLHPFSFEVSSGNIVGIMGGSGAGKSTLLSVLTGLNHPASGKVLMNNTDIHTQRQATEGLIGYVSQDDLLVEELTVFQNLYFNAKLCFGQLTDDEIRIKTDDVLRDLGLYEIRDMKVGTPLNKKISGGQRKRLNIALEMIRQPAVLFLDEPTSGLSSRDSDNIIDLLKELSLKGKLVFVVIHQPSSDIFKMFDRLLVLDKGGYLIYNGNPVDAVLYFKSQIHQANRDTSECPECGNVNPEQIFNIVEARVLNEQGQTTDTRRISPAEWYESFKFQVSGFKSSSSEPETSNLKLETSNLKLETSNLKPETSNLKPETSNLKLETSNLKRPSRLKQFAIYVRRNILTKISDLQYITVCLLEAPLLALLLAYIIRYYNISEGSYTFEMNDNLPIYIFVAVIIAIFVGLSVSAEEIIKDRKMLKRESFLNLSRGSYLFSKTFVLFAISAIQAILFVWAGNSVTGILHQTFAYWLVLFSAWTCANLMGLIISDAFKSVVTIYILIPFIVIPQMMLSGALLRFEKINPDISTPASIPWYGEIVTARWAFEALAVEQYMNNQYESILYPYEKNMSIADFHKNYWIVEMKNKLNDVKLYTDDEKQNDALLKFIGDEIERENKRQDVVQFQFQAELSSGGLSQNLIDETLSYFEQLSRYYSALYNKTAELKDRLTNQIADVNPDSLLFLKSRYHNQSLADMLKNNSETYRIIEYKGKFLQNYHQIYKDPENTFVKAHFYAPSKQVFGAYYPTLWVNVIVIWAYNILFFVALYFRWLPKLLEALQKRKK